MNLKFYGLGSDLKEILYNEFNKNEKVFYIFEDSVSCYEMRRDYVKGCKNPFYNFLLLKEADFYERLFKTDKIVIREEKQVVLFYNSLTEKIKKDMKIGTYYDVIDLAYNFYNLFSELQEYKIDIYKIKSEEWQREVFENLIKINEAIERQVSLKGVILPYMLRKKENISETFIKKCKKICFVNKVKFTPFEREIIEFLEGEGIIIENIVQLDKNDFDLEKMEIRNTFRLPEREVFEKKGINLEIHQFSSKFTQLMGIVKKLEEEREKESVQYRVYDGEETKSAGKRDYQLLNQNRIVYNLEESMENTEIYRVLDILYNILENVKVEKASEGEKKYIFKLKELYKGFKCEEFLNIFDLKESYDQFQYLVSDGYKYISIGILEKLEEENKLAEIGKLSGFLTELETLYRIDNLSDYGKYMEDIFKRQKKAKGKIRDKYFEALSEVVVLEDFSFDDLWKGFFNKNISSGLLKMFLKYLDKKSIGLDLEEMEEEEGKKYKISSFSALSHIKKENIMFLNLQEPFPKVKVNNYLFSKGQRIDMGLPVSEDMKQVELFKFLNNIYGGKNVYLSYVGNVDENIGCSGIVEEIRLKYGIDVKGDSEGGEISEAEELAFIKKYFTVGKKKWERKEIGPFIPSRLLKDREKLATENLSLGYYSFEKLKEFEYGYYMEKMIGNTEVEEIDEKIDPLLFGNIIHTVYEKIVKRRKEEIENGEYFAGIEEIKEVLSSVLTAFEYKIPTEFIRFYREVSFDEIAKSIKRFFDSLKNGGIEELEKADKFEIYSEEKIRQKLERGMEGKKYKNVLIKGIMDLYIKTGREEILIDYKSGNLEGRRLLKAQEQLDFYSILLGDEKTVIRKKYVVDTWTGEIKGDKRGIGRNKGEELLKEDVEKAVENYFERDFYGLGEKNTTFNHKLYKDVARREEEDDEDRK